MSESGQKHSLKRLSTRRYQATVPSGGELIIGYGPGEFTPGDLLKLAVLGCNASSSDARFARALGDDFELTGSIDAEYSKEEDRFLSFAVDLQPDLRFMDPQAREQLLKRVAGAVLRYCTITHTLDHTAPSSLSVDGQEVEH